jgi:uncharacterized protein with WD repeat
MRARVKPGATFKNLEDDEPAENAKVKDADDKLLSKSALKNKKRKANKTKEAQQQQPAASANNVTAVSSTSHSASAPAGAILNPETEKQLRKLTQKLEAIEALKKKRNGGTKLELNQLEKLKTEKGLVEQIAQLKLQG